VSNANARRQPAGDTPTDPLDDYVRRVIAACPPLTAAQRDRIAGLLRTAPPAAVRQPNAA
jgi:hypothetical protein